MKTGSKKAGAASAGTGKKRRIRRSLPGDRPRDGQTRQDGDIARMIRVNHAGEYGARQIYRGQLAVLGDDPRTGSLLRHMAEQEEAHLDYFEKEIVRRRIRPTALQPLWHAAGYALGYVTARMGKEAAMACTVAVEEVISRHYAQQLETLADCAEEKALEENIARFKAEEEEHHDIGLENDAESAPGYALLGAAIRAGSRLAIRIAKRV